MDVSFQTKKKLFFIFSIDEIQITLEALPTLLTKCQCFKTFYNRNLQIIVIS
jgi:hypothetical protein